MLQLKLISTPRAQSQFLILSFLKSEAWTSHENLCELLDISTHQLKIILNTLIKEKLIKEVLQEIMGGKTQLYGITRSGCKRLDQWRESSLYPLGLATGKSKSPPNLLTERISPTFIPHRLDVQMLRIRAERAGWTDWVSADIGRPIFVQERNHIDMSGSLAQRAFRPDAWCTDPQKLRVCVECERTMKSKARYSQILCDYLLALKRGEFDRVIWVCPDQKMRQNLQKTIMSITHVQIGSLMVAVPRGRFDNLSFMTFEEWAV